MEFPKVLIFPGHWMLNCSSSLWISDLDFQVIGKKQVYPQGPLKFSWLLGQGEYFSGWFGKLQPESFKVKGKLDTSETQNLEKQLFPIPCKYSSLEGAAL